MYRILLIAVATLTIAVECDECRSALILSVDQSAETFSLLGDDTGVPQSDSFSSVFEWFFIISSPSGTINPGSISPAVTSSALLDGANSFQITEDNPVSYVNLALGTTSTVLGVTTVSGDITDHDYSGFSIGQKTLLQAAIDAGSIPLTTGTGFSPILVETVNSTGVPEPSTLALTSLGLLALVRRRRR